MEYFDNVEIFQIYDKKSYLLIETKLKYWNTVLPKLYQ